MKNFAQETDKKMDFNEFRDNIKQVNSQKSLCNLYIQEVQNFILSKKGQSHQDVPRKKGDFSGKLNI